jgi:hypothetical protein
MRRIGGAALIAAMMAAPVTASAAVSWPIVLVGVICIDDACTDMAVYIHEDGTFSDGEAWTGEWSWFGRLGEEGALEIRYDPGQGWDYYYRGYRSGDCISGAIYGFAGDDAGDFNFCF